MQLNVHEGQRLLHVLDVRGGIIGMLFACPQVSPQFAQSRGRAGSWPQQPAGVKSLQPLRIVDIALPARHRTRFPGIGKNDLQATRLQHFVGGDPINPGRFHDHGLGAGRHQPVCHALQIAGKRLESLDGFIAQVGTDRCDMESRADVDASGKGMNDRQPGGLGSGSLLDMVHLLSQ
jgi:hypothetical protein